MNAKTWRERVAEARERGAFTIDDWADAGDWLKCAVGEQHAKHPHVVVYFQDVVPQDSKLGRLGCGTLGFSGRVAAHDFAAADQLLDQIEDRILELKREYTEGSAQGGDA